MSMFECNAQVFMWFLLLFLHVVLLSGIPQCSIRSDEDTDSLEPGTQLTLTVDITGYYCSVETGFDLTTGDVTEELGMRHTVSVVTDLTVNTNFSVDITRFGDVTLDFTCDRSWPLNCNGVRKLLKNDHFGDVTVTFLCDSIIRPLVCDGVDKLSVRQTVEGRLQCRIYQIVGVQHWVSMKMVDRKIISLVLLNLIASFTCAQTATQCPGGMALLGSEYTIVAVRNYTGFVWVDPSDRNVVICHPVCVSAEPGYNATLNDTHSTLIIHSVRMKDVGNWFLRDATVDAAVPVDLCQLTAAGIPQCSISSDEDTDSLEPGTQLTLAVDITGYYCSVETGFDLTTGDVTEELGTRHNVSVVTDITITTNFSVDITRLGDVMLDFTCDRSWTVTCNGVRKLLKTPPHCNISSDTDTTALDPGTNLTLTLDIRNYYCSQTAGFQLTTGIITETLLENHTMDNITDTVLTQFLSVTADHFGDVTVTFMCDSITRPLVCDGVDKLSGVTSSTTETSAVTISSATSLTTETSTTTVPDVTTPGLESPTTPPDVVSTPISPTPVDEENPPIDATLGLAIGLPVLVVLLIILGVIIYRYRQQIGNYLVTRKKDTELQNSNFNKVE
ncbi:uncharacterized protein LOC124265964 [Haliotis rubra]|uniref:uncharacterized protein LOC124265964 n=1 Tax=Haliotis rubra TaxID=36100 RepID=UPI001EE564C8|nr:uncharacterized protein LOC124265964 [Haliotis rubra]